MFRRAFAFTAALLIALGTAPIVGAQGVEGNWKVSYVTFGSEQTTAIVKIKTEDGKTTGELVAGSPRMKGLALKSVSQDGSTLRIVMENAGLTMTFETNVPKDAGKLLKGVLAVESTAYPAMLASTDETALDFKSTVRPIKVAPYEQARSLLSKSLPLRIQAQKEKDPDKKRALLKQAAEADQVAKKETPKLYREVLDKHADTPVVFDAALTLIKSAQSTEAKIDDVKGWASVASNAAKAYGPRWQTEVSAQTAVALVGQEGFAELALEYARLAEKTLPPKSAPADEVRVVIVMMRSLAKNGKGDDAKKYEGRLANLDLVLDREYVAKMPPFKGSKFDGRKANSDRAVFMELFTGAACPPCVAADLAFDVLQTTYRPTELVLVQYHMHIPGPDPLTNPDTEARWSYYGKAFPKGFLGVPSSAFNGKPKAGGGGGIANAESKYTAYRAVIEPLLEETTPIKLTAKATRKGDQIDINVDVAGVPEPGADKKLRILLAEATVHYPGSNRIRIHHNVVRAFPGGVAGTALKEADSKHKTSIVLGDLRTQLTKYLNDFQAGGKIFSHPSRPMAMDYLRVIAIVQDDRTHEILQAVQVEVK